MTEDFRAYIDLDDKRVRVSTRRACMVGEDLKKGCYYGFAVSSKDPTIYGKNLISRKYVTTTDRKPPPMVYGRDEEIGENLDKVTKTKPQDVTIIEELKTGGSTKKQIKKLDVKLKEAKQPTKGKEVKGTKKKEQPKKLSKIHFDEYWNIIFPLGVDDWRGREDKYIMMIKNFIKKTGNTLTGNEKSIITHKLKWIEDDKKKRAEWKKRATNEKEKKELKKLNVTLKEAKQPIKGKDVKAKKTTTKKAPKKTTTKKPKKELTRSQKDARNAKARERYRLKQKPKREAKCKEWLK
jgi:hypothetical protein